MIDCSIPLDEAAHAAAYRGARERITELVRSADPAALDKIAPATPKWRARDLLAHMVGVASDVVNGNIADAAADHWTAAQVDVRHDRPLDALLAEWDEVGPQIESLLLALPTSVTGQLLGDTATHEHDLRHALGCPGARDSDAIVIGVAWVIGVLGPVYDAAGTRATRFESEAFTATAGTGDVDATVRASTFELGRAITGRRTVEEISAYDWTPAAYPERLLVIPLFTPPARSLSE